MARSTENALTKLYSGKFANVCIQRDGIIRSLPDMSHRKLSEKQINQLSRFERAKAYARQVIDDPALSEHYNRFLPNFKATISNIGIYQLAIKDYMHEPEVLAVYLEHEFGNDVPLIAIKASDCIDDPYVYIRLVSSDGRVQEEGDADLMSNLDHYQYTIRDHSLVREDITCIVRVSNITGNHVEKEYSCFPVSGTPKR